MGRATVWLNWAFGILLVTVAGIACSEPQLETQQLQPRQALVAHGKHLFSQNCATCHGNDGEGALGPALVGNRNLQNGEYVIARILLGGAGMPPFHPKLSTEQIGAVASYIRTAWEDPSATAPVIPTQRQQVQRQWWGQPGGAELYSRVCARCHGDDGGGYIGPTLIHNQNLESAQYVVAKILHGEGGMPAFEHLLSDEQIATLGTHIRTAWGNTYGPIEVEQVRTAQGQLPEGQPDRTILGWPQYEGASNQQVPSRSQPLLSTRQENPLYSEHCESCHGSRGSGGVAPPLAGNRNLQNTAYVVSRIVMGGGGMPGFGARLSSSQIAELASQIRTSWGNDYGAVSLAQAQSYHGGGAQGAQQEQAGQPSGGRQGQVNGQQVYQNNCARCHGQEGEGGTGPALAGNQQLQNAQYILDQIRNGGGGMPAFGDQLSDQQINAVASYIRTSWGNSFGEVGAQQVGGGQGGQQGQEQPPSPTGGAMTGGAGVGGQQMLQPGQAASGQLEVAVDPGAARLAVLGPDRYVYFRARSDGEVLTGLQPGRYAVAATKDGHGPAQQEVEVGAGEEATITLTLPLQNGER